MNIHRDDPRLTAYALGELEGDERSAVEAALAADDALRAEVEEIRHAAAFLTEELAAESPDELSAPQRAVIEGVFPEMPKQAPKEAPKGKVVRFPFKAVALAGTALAAAAAMMVVVSVYGTGREDDAVGVTNGVAAPADVTLAMPEEPTSEEADYDVAEQGEVRFGIDSQLQRNLRPPGYAGTETATPNRESYAVTEEQGYMRTAIDPRSTFSIDVDTASYSMVRRFIEQGQRPPEGAVRIEEMVNYFRYDYREPRGEHPFSVTTEVASAPWNADHRLLRIGLRGRALAMHDRRASNLVFLLDVSGSMQDENKLPLLVRGLSMLVEQLDADDRISIVVYAGASGLVLPPTRGDRTAAITGALERLSAGGSTNGGEGIRLAYSIAADNYVRGGVNRVILATDGDFNVGTTDQSDLVRLVEEKARSGVFLTVLGLGQGNYQDSLLEQLADRGNGNYAYIDSLSEAQRVLVEQGTGTLVTIAKDVKIQLEFDQDQVESFRLIGYDNRRLAHRDFDDDTRDAGEIGAGHTITALYEIVPHAGARPGRLGTVSLRYKQPEGETSQLLSASVTDRGEHYTDASDDFRFAAAVASFGMLLRRSEHAGDASYPQVVELARAGLGRDNDGRRAELLGLARRAAELRLE